MSDGPENLVLLYLRRTDHRRERIEEDVRDLKYGVMQTEEGIGNPNVCYAGLQQRMDRLDNRLDRIERRLDLHEAPR